MERHPSWVDGIEVCSFYNEQRLTYEICAEDFRIGVLAKIPYFSKSCISVETAGNPPNPLPFHAKKAVAYHRDPQLRTPFPSLLCSRLWSCDLALGYRRPGKCGCILSCHSFLRSQTQPWLQPKFTTKMKTVPWRVNGKLDGRKLR